MRARAIGLGGAALLVIGAMQQPPPLPEGQVAPAPEPAAPPADDLPGEGRVVGGEDADPGTAPWQAQIYSTYNYTAADTEADLRKPAAEQFRLDLMADWEKVHRCAGVYIGDNFVLTAAHCLEGVANFTTSRRIRLGTQNLTRPGVTFRIADYRINRGFRNQEPYPDDIALIRIEADNPEARAFDLGSAAIRMLGTRASDIAVRPGDRMRVTGWGRTQARAAVAGPFAASGAFNHYSPVLKQLDQRPDAAACQARYGYTAQQLRSVVCAVAYRAGADSCNGDSGGPLTRMQGSERVLVGLVSWGRGCALPGMPAVYTSVTAQLGWINRAKSDMTPRRQAN